MLLKVNGKMIARDVEMADTLLKRTMGLMFRMNIPQDYAMFFSINKPCKFSIHMLFVPFSLDVFFLDSNYRITQIESLRPWLGFARAKNATRYVVEMAAGSVEKYGLEVGQQMSLENTHS
ncbi:DUF192 domain-containing protein [Methanohalophilus portucalensis]|uniref:DUF192 domain-containing protein n=2 Tax=Methanohalophilus portucalensis TaxID=39664 RepID=A0A1L9C5C8_9EURY|nr:DUF192 domain-containing protein [Methanohalophilus portucalensis]ATU08396.1 hypothetical protein BKM01_06185 [Methanohalophilus portucalensis]OJH49732.1 hypothetical protein MPF_0520 [Methanohalophilus portucalensis FDF-1]RNI13437.1 DUF192 domain-containing protein [Methanohalophilus portucalensis FDF-1]SMH34241.1 hypothetical protein SAMN06264941_0821 [Methanohalophilus portucalensis FDF-1]